jgi:DNA-binding GntR family transcriptional regulator
LKKRPRYERIARALGSRIASGRFAVGATLPTEAELCKRYGVSRHTAREALRRLREAGLVTRRPRAGTTVAAASARVEFTLPVSSAADLFRYATDAQFIVQSRERIRAAGADLAALGCRRGQPWFKLTGIRKRPGIATPVCLITVYLHESLGRVARKIPRLAGVIYPRIEKELGIRIAWIRQRIEAVALNPDSARKLDSKPGSCGLRVRRYYYDGNERLLEMSDSLHAAGRFAYEMRLRRD